MLYAEVSLDEKQRLYNQLVVALKRIIDFELLKTPKIPADGFDEAAFNVMSDELVESARQMMNSIVQANSDSLNWLEYATTIEQSLHHTVSSQYLGYFSFIDNVKTVYDITNSISNLLAKADSIFSAMLDASSVYVTTQRCIQYKSLQCLGAEEKGPWESYTRKQGEAVLIPPEAYDRLSGIQYRITELEQKANIGSNPPKVTLVSNTGTISESQENYQAQVKLGLTAGSLLLPVTVQVNPGSGSATAGDDFNGQAITVTFPIGSQNGAIQIANIAIYDDYETENSETFYLTLSNASGGGYYDSPQPQTAISITDSSAGAGSTTSLWKERQTNNTLQGISYNNGLFVSVAPAGTIMVSSDGVQWEVRPSGTTNNLYGSSYGNGRYVVVGNDGAISYSDDGLNWNYQFWLAAGGANTDYRAVTYHNGLFVAVGLSGIIFTSSDGIYWQQQSSGVTEHLYAIEYGAGHFVAVGYSGRVLTSSDGLTWAARTMGDTAYYYGLSYAGGQFVAVGNSGYTHTSIDGITWTVKSNAGSYRLDGVTYDGSQYIATGDHGYVYTSPDGKSWTYRGDLGNDKLDIAYGGGRIVAVGYGGEVNTSTNGLTWAARTMGDTAYYYGLSYAGGQFVAVGSSGYTHTSIDGITWTVKSNAGSYRLDGVTYDGSQYIATGDHGYVYTSLDGKSWTYRGDLGNDKLDIAYGGGRIVAVGYGGEVNTSIDGVNWSAATSATTSTLLGVSYGSSGFVAVGASGVIQTSPDGQVWTLQSSGTTQNLNDVGYGLGVWVAVGAGGALLRSTDGINWYYQKVTSGTGNINAISFGEHGFVAMGDGGKFWQSKDLGNTWYVGQTGATRNIYDVIQTSAGVYAVGASGLVLDSLAGTVTHPQSATVSLNLNEAYGPIWGNNEERKYSYFKITVPANVSDLIWSIGGGYGNPDLYLRYEALPDESNFDCRPLTPGGNETCWMDNPAAGTWYGMVRGANFYNETMVTVVAKFEDKHPLQVSKTGHGMVSSINRSGISCGTDCDQNYNAGSAVTLRAEPEYGWVFSGWSGACAGTSDCSVTMSTTKNVSATFSQQFINNPPVWADITPQLVTVGQTLNVTLLATDADVVTYQLHTAGPALSGSQLSWAPTSLNEGVNSIKVSASDGVNSPVNKYISVYVQPSANQAPTISPIADQSVKPGEWVDFTLIVSDANSADTVTVTPSNMPAGATFVNNRFKLQASYEQIGTHFVTFTASDGILSAELVVIISISDANVILETNSAPTVLPIGDKYVSINDNVSFTVSAHDPDNDSVTISATGLPQGASFEQGLFSWVPTSSGSVSINFTAYDGVAYSQVMTVVIYVQKKSEFNFSQSSYIVDETDGTIGIPVTRTASSTGAVSVLCQTSDDTAEAGLDYTAVNNSNGWLNWADGDSSIKYCEVSITADAIPEGNESFTVTLSNPTSGALVGSIDSATIIIADINVNQIKQVEAGFSHSCALNDNGVLCWGYNEYGQINVPTLSNPTQVTAGADHSCALDDSGVVCWGADYYGQSSVPELINPTQVAAGGTYSCALDDGGVVCWGYNEHGQTSVPALSNPTQVIAGATHSCALDDSGVVCWGGDDYGQTSVPALSNPTQVAAGGLHSCALDDSSVVCWGYNEDGQTSVPALSNPTQIKAGSFHSCAIDDSGVVCWGWNEYGQSSVPNTLTTGVVFDDFNGDGKADILIRHNSTGQLYLHEMDGNIRTGSSIGALSTVWAVEGMGDFGGDGKADILTRHSSTGQLYLDEMDGNIRAGSGIGALSPIWAVAGIGDFGGDGKADILLRHTVTGQLYLLEMDSNQKTGSNIGGLSLGWDVVGVDDFGGDGKADILLRNTASGQLYLYEMDGNQKTGSNIGGLSLGWDVVGTGDLDGDGKADIVLRNINNGQLYLYEMDGNSRTGSNIGGLPLAWDVVRIADYGGDGKADLLLRNINNGQLFLYEMDSNQVTPSNIGGLNPAWEVQVR